MKVLRVITTMDPKSGGPCQGIRNSIPELEKLGLNTDVVCFDPPDSTYNDNFKIYCIGPAKGPYAYCPNLENWLKRNINQYDYIIIHGLWLYNNYGTYKVWKNLKKRNLLPSTSLYIMPHGMLDPYFQKAKDRKLKAIRNFIFWKIIEKNAVNGCDGILFTCEREKELAEKAFFPYNPKRAITVGYGIPNPPTYDSKMNEAFVAQSKTPIPKNPYLLFLSRIHPKKGIDLLIKAYNSISINEKFPKLVIAGPGLESSYGKEIKKIASENPDIIFTGMLTGDAKWAAIYNCEAFILPSHQENFGIAVVEALSCRKPVLITNKVNIFKEIQTCKAGIVENDTLKGTELLLKQWKELSIEEKMILNKNAELCFKEKFSVEKAAIKMLKKLNNN